MLDDPRLASTSDAARLADNRISRCSRRHAELLITNRRVAGDTCYSLARGNPQPPRQMDRHPSAARLDVWERAMDGTFFSLHSFSQRPSSPALVAGVAGFAFALIAAAAWLHVLHPARDRDPDYRLRHDRAGLRRLETAARLELDAVLAVPARRRGRCRDRRDSCCDGPTRRTCGSGIGGVPRRVFALQPRPPGAETGARRRCWPTWRRAFSTACSARMTGFRRHPHRDLVRNSRLAAATSSAGSFSRLASLCWRCARSRSASPARSAVDTMKLFLLGLPALALGTWAGLHALWPARRSELPQHRADAASGFGIVR